MRPGQAWAAHLGPASRTLPDGGMLRRAPLRVVQEHQPSQPSQCVCACRHLGIADHRCGGACAPVPTLRTCSWASAAPPHQRTHTGGTNAAHRGFPGGACWLQPAAAGGSPTTTCGQGRTPAALRGQGSRCGFGRPKCTRCLPPGLPQCVLTRERRSHNLWAGAGAAGWWRPLLVGLFRALLPCIPPNLHTQDGWCSLAHANASFASSAAADEDSDFEARLAALKKAKGETPYGAGKKAEAAKASTAAAGESQRSASTCCIGCAQHGTGGLVVVASADGCDSHLPAAPKYDYSDETLYFESGPHAGDVAVNVALGAYLFAPRRV